MKFVTQSEVQSEIRRHVPVILPVERIRISQPIHRVVIRRAYFGVVGISEQKRGVGIANGCTDIRRSVEHIPTRTVVAEDVVIVIPQPLEISPNFRNMLPQRPRHVVQRLNDLPALHPGIAGAG